MEQICKYIDESGEGGPNDAVRAAVMTTQTCLLDVRETGRHTHLTPARLDADDLDR